MTGSKARLFRWRPPSRAWTRLTPAQVGGVAHDGDDAGATGGQNNQASIVLADTERLVADDLRVVQPVFAVPRLMDGGMSCSDLAMRSTSPELRTLPSTPREG